MNHKTQVLGSAILLLLLTICACGQAHNNSSISNAMPSETAPAEQADSSSTKVGERQSGFDDATNQTVTFSGLEFSIPAYLNVQSDDSGETQLHFYPKPENYYCSLIFFANEVDLTQEEFNERRSNLDESYLKSIGENTVLTASENTTIAGLPARSISYFHEGAEYNTTYHYGVVYIASSKNLITVLQIHDSKDESNYDYDGDFEKILNSAILLPQEESNSATDSSADDIRPEFKKAMDTYEAFFDEYIAFMENYSTSSNTLSLLNDYLDFMTRYTETMTALEEMDTSDMSAAESAYYTEVMLRINQKLYSSIS